MNTKNLSMQNKSPEIFTVWSDEMEGRIDPFFYRSEFVDIENNFKEFKHMKVKDISGDIKNGSTPQGGVFEKSGVPYFRSQDFELFDFRINQYIKPEFHKKILRSSIMPGDVLVAVVGATLGVVGYVPSDLNGNINQNVARIRVKNKRINPKYLAIILNSKYGQRQIYRLATSTTQAYLNNKQLGEVKIPLLSMEVQNKIIAIMQKAHEEKQHKETEAKELLSSIDDYVLSELGIRLSKVESKMCFSVWSNEVEGRRLDPKAYENKTKEIFKTIQKGRYGIVLLKELIVDSISGEWGWDVDILPEGENFIKCFVLRNTNFDNKHNLNFDDVAERLIPKSKLEKIQLQKNDLLIEKSGGSPVQPVGRIAIIDNLPFDKPVVFSNFLQKFKIDTKTASSSYIFVLLKTFHSLGFTDHLQNQTTGIKNLIMEEFLSLPIPLPSLSLQEKISNEAKSRIEQAQRLTQEVKELLEEAKQKVEKMILGE